MAPMLKRREVLFEIMMQLPWFAGLAIALLVFVLMAHVLPPLAAHSPISDNLGRLSAMFAPWVAGLLVVVSVTIFVRSLADRYPLRRNQDVEALRRLNWSEFERFVCEAFRRDGYHTIEIPADTGVGVDLTLRRNDQAFLVRYRHWKSRQTGLDSVRELHEAMTAAGADGGFVLTAGSFTQDARDFAAQSRIELIDGEALLHMIARIRNSMEKERLRHSTVAEAPVLQTPPCPQCGRPMVKRLTVKGPYAGEYFWGCSEFPSCRSTIDIR